MQYNTFLCIKSLFFLILCITGIDLTIVVGFNIGCVVEKDFAGGFIYYGKKSDNRKRIQDDFIFCASISFSYFLQTLYGMADLFIIGQFNGTESTTAVANGSQVMHMLTVMIVGLAMGSTVMIGRAVGARHKDEIAKQLGTP